MVRRTFITRGFAYFLDEDGKNLLKFETEDRRMKMVSIVIPAYNEDTSLSQVKAERDQLQRTVRDVEFEFIVIDNASTDQPSKLA